MLGPSLRMKKKLKYPRLRAFRLGFSLCFDHVVSQAEVLKFYDKYCNEFKVCER